MDSLRSIDMDRSIGSRRRGDGRCAFMANVEGGAREDMSRYRRFAIGNNDDPLTNYYAIILKYCTTRFKILGDKHRYHSIG